MTSLERAKYWMEKWEHEMASGYPSGAAKRGAAGSYAMIAIAETLEKVHLLSIWKDTIKRLEMDNHELRMSVMSLKSLMEELQHHTRPVKKDE